MLWCELHQVLLDLSPVESFINYLDAFAVYFALESIGAQNHKLVISQKRLHETHLPPWPVVVS